MSDGQLIHVEDPLTNDMESVDASGWTILDVMGLKNPWANVATTDGVFITVDTADTRKKCG